MDATPADALRIFIVINYSKLKALERNVQYLTTINFMDREAAKSLSKKLGNVI